MDPRSPFPCAHDHYLRRFILGEPRLNYDVILIVRLTWLGPNFTRARLTTLLRLYISTDCRRPHLRTAVVASSSIAPVDGISRLLMDPCPCPCPYYPQDEAQDMTPLTMKLFLDQAARKSSISPRLPPFALLPKLTTAAGPI